jgi:hypothetical protein
MKLFSLVLSAVLMPCFVGLAPFLSKTAGSEPSPSTHINQPVGSITLQTKTAVLQYGKKGAAFPDGKQAIVRYPIASGLADAVLTKKVQEAISLKQVLGQSLAEMQKDYLGNSWLNEVSYTVNYNQDNILDLTYLVSGSAAYPSSYEKHVSVSLKTGKVLRARDLFKAEGVRAIAQTIEPMMQQEILQKIAEFGKEDPDINRDLFAKHHFQAKNVEEFTIGKTGVTFLYNFDFPHVIKAAEPSGAYLMPYSKLARYIRQDGALNFAIWRNKGE